MTVLRHPGGPIYLTREADQYDSLSEGVISSLGCAQRLILGGRIYPIEATLSVTDEIVIQGEGTNVGADSGSIIQNTTNDVVAIEIVGAANATAQRCVLSDFGVQHEAASEAAIAVTRGPYTMVNNVVIDCNSAGHTGLLLGSDAYDTTSDLQTNEISAWQSVCHNVRIDDATDYGFNVNTQGHTIAFYDCSPRSSVNGAHGFYISSNNVHIFGGQHGANNTGGIPVYFYNRRGGALRGGSVNYARYEGIDSGEFAIVIDGDTDSYFDIHANNCVMHLGNEAGTLIKFGRAQECWLNFPDTPAPTGGGKLVEWTANSVDCGIRVNYQASRAPITVNASATGAIKEVYGIVARADLSNITVDDNLRTILIDGIDEAPPGFQAVHYNGEWNISFHAMTDDTAVAITPPTAVGILTLLNDDEISTCGEVLYDTRSAVTPVILGGGADFEVSTGTLDGTGGGTGTENNNKLTVSSDTSSGDIYVSARKGASNMTVMFKSAVYSV